MLLAVVPVIVPILAAIGVVGIGGVVWWYAKDSNGALQPGDQPGQPNTGPGGDVPGPGAPKELVDSLAALYTDGRFHETQQNDSISKVAYQTVKKISPAQADKPAMVSAVRRLLNRSKWNRDLFGESMPDDPYAFEGVAINRFSLPKHEDTVEVMRLGFLPIRNIDANGKRVGPSQKWADPWVPRLNHDAVLAGVTDDALLLAPPYEDGTPATEPPPELLAVLEERA